MANWWDEMTADFPENIFSGGGFDDQGSFGLIGDVGGYLGGNYGANYSSANTLPGLVDLGIGAYNFDQIGDSFDEARVGVNDAYNTAEGAVTDAMEGGLDAYQGMYDKAYDDTRGLYEGGLETLSPYLEAGQTGLDRLGEMEPFEFSYDNYLNSDNFQWMQDQTTQARERGAAAQGSLYSGNTLQDLNRDMFNVNAREYGAEHGRQLAEWNTGLEINNQLVQAGLGGLREWGNLTTTTMKTLADLTEKAGTTIAEILNNYGTNIAEMAIGRGTNIAGLTMAESQAMANILSSMVSDRSGAGGGAGGGSAGGAGGLAGLAGKAAAGIPGAITGTGIGSTLGSVAGATAAAAGSIPSAAVAGATYGTPASMFGTPGLGNGPAAMFPGAPSASPVAGGTAANAAGLGVDAAGNAVASSLGSFLGSLGIGFGVLGGVALLSKGFEGGAADSAKTKEVMSQIQRAENGGFTHPVTGERVTDAGGVYDHIIRGKTWLGEAGSDSQYVITPAIEAGILSEYFPSFYAKDSQFSIFDGGTGMVQLKLAYGWDMKNDSQAASLGINDDLFRNASGGAFRGWYESGITNIGKGFTTYDSQAEENVIDENKINRIGGGGATSRWIEDFIGAPLQAIADGVPRDLDARLRQNNMGKLADQIAYMGTKMSPEIKLSHATDVYNSITNTGYTGDLTKLEDYILGA